MKDKLLEITDIYMQDIICEIVFANPQKDNFDIYNLVSEKVDIPDIKTVEDIFKLIKLNKLALIQ